MALLITLCSLASWYAIGYLFWRAVHYGAIKWWYLQYKEDYSNSAPSVNWKNSQWIICIGGLINLVVLPFSGLLKGTSFKHGVTINYKVPKGTPRCRY